MENLYDIIGVSPSVSDEELDSAYKKLREKYGEERFQNGPAGEEAADKLEKLERAYSEIKRARSEYKSYGQDSEQAYAAIEEVLKNGDINKAQEMLDNLAKLAKEMQRELPGAVAAGINLEGPFINPFKRGAQQEESILPIDLEFARALIDAGGGMVKVMTFAPELEKAAQLVEFLIGCGVKPSMGHSIANEEQTMRAIDAGASYCTHLFNGMPPLHQREMGLSSIALTDDRVTVELIIDGRHIHPRMVDLACRCKTSSKLVGISDCTMAAGMPNGEYRIGPSMIRVKDGYSQTDQGILAGTTTMLDTGWHSLMSGGHLTALQAASAVTSNPANAFQLKDRGLLLPNRRADLAVYESNTNRPLLTVCNGRIVYRAEDRKK